MARIKYNKLGPTEGIVGTLSGQGKVLIADKSGVLRGLKSGVYVKRPNQYKKKRK